jgi:hypothetical protein
MKATVADQVTGIGAVAGISLANFFKFWAAEAVELEDSFEVGEAHLDLLALSPRGYIGDGLGDVAGKVSCAFTRHKSNFFDGKPCLKQPTRAFVAKVMEMQVIDL